MKRGVLLVLLAVGVAGAPGVPRFLKEGARCPTSALRESGLVAKTPVSPPHQLRGH